VRRRARQRHRRQDRLLDERHHDGSGLPRSGRREREVRGRSGLRDVRRQRRQRRRRPHGLQHEPAAVGSRLQRPRRRERARRRRVRQRRGRGPRHPDRLPHRHDGRHVLQVGGRHEREVHVRREHRRRHPPHVRRQALGVGLLLGRECVGPARQQRDGRCAGPGPGHEPHDGRGGCGGRRPQLRAPDRWLGVVLGENAKARSATTPRPIDGPRSRS